MNHDLKDNSRQSETNFFNVNRLLQLYSDLKSDLSPQLRASITVRLETLDSMSLNTLLVLPILLIRKVSRFFVNFHQQLDK